MSRCSRPKPCPGALRTPSRRRPGSTRSPTGSPTPCPAAGSRGEPPPAAPYAYRPTCEDAMARAIIIDGAEEVACPKCSHRFPLSEGISKQTIERYAEDFERAFAEQKRELEAQLAVEARRRAER